MDPTDIGLFRLAERRLSWVDQRQEVLAQNIANADTPGYRARDLAPFEASLAAQGVTLARTNPSHLEGSLAASRGRQERGTGKAPDGNAVSMEEQLGKVADTASAQELVTNLYHKYQGLFRTVLGRSG
jgi:flagellar basal-body rod protein FlgB